MTAPLPPTLPPLYHSNTREVSLQRRNLAGRALFVLEWGGEKKHVISVC